MVCGISSLSNEKARGEKLLGLNRMKKVLGVSLCREGIRAPFFRPYWLGQASSVHLWTTAILWLWASRRTTFTAETKGQSYSPSVMMGRSSDYGQGLSGTVTKIDGLEGCSFISEKSEWIRTKTFGEHMALCRPKGLVYLNCNSYREMGEWAYPDEMARLYEKASKETDFGGKALPFANAPSLFLSERRGERFTNSDLPVQTWPT